MTIAHRGSKIKVNVEVRVSAGFKYVEALGRIIII